jgi:hypothetical protein
MSYDIHLEIDTGGPEPATLTDWNFTSNVSAMWCAAGTDLAEHDGKKAGDLIDELGEAISELKAQPARYRAMDSPNGWGTYEHLLPQMEVLLAQYRAHPLATVRVSR